MNETNETTITPTPGPFHKIYRGDIKPPEQVRCMNCGEMAEYEENEVNSDLIVWVYGCFDCRHWTEWEIAADGSDIYSSAVWLVDMDDEDRESFPGNGSEWYWEPGEDGYSVGEES
jgi:hypothetical protein